MSDSVWARGSGRKGLSRPPIKGESNGVTCPVCHKENLAVYVGELEQHKSYKLDRRGRRTTTWWWCSGTLS